MLCPTHNTVLIATATRYGTRYGCPLADCTVAYWPGPTSTPADAQTRQLRHQGHCAFDPLWKQTGTFTSRANAYDWLARQMGMTRRQCHFGLFTAEECRRALAVIALAAEVAP